PDNPPLPVVKAWRIPAASFTTSVVGLAVIDLGHQNGTSRRLPVLIRRDDLFTPVLVVDLELREKSKPPPVQVARVLATEITAVPSVAENHTNSIVAFTKQAGHIICLVLKPLVVTRPAGRED